MMDGLGYLLKAEGGQVRFLPCIQELSNEERGLRPPLDPGEQTVLLLRDQHPIPSEEWVN